jgi:uncharacterized protein (TIGR02300 family)
MGLSPLIEAATPRLLAGRTKLLTAGPDGGKRAPRRKENALAKTDLGDKQICPSCGAKFYDLRRRPAVCPKCTSSFDPAEEGVRVKRGRARIAAHDPVYEDEEETAKAKKKTGDEDDEEEEVEEAVEVDIEAEPEVLVVDDEETEKVASEDEIPEGFSEDEGETAGDAADDDSVPMIEDDEEFPEDEIGELPATDDEEGR